MKQIATILIIFCFSCSLKPSKSQTIDKTYPLDTTKIEFDGFYNRLDTSVIRIEHCKNLIKRKKDKKPKTIDEIVFGNKNEKLRDSIVSVARAKSCEDNGKKRNDIFTSNSLVVFNKKKELYIDYGSNSDESPYKCFYYKMKVDWHNEHKEELFGNYSIKDDSVYAYVPVTFVTRGMIPRTVNCNYRGYIKNKDTIIDWKVVPPYPKGTNRFVKENNKDLFQPQTLYFVKTDAVKCLQMD